MAKLNKHLLMLPVKNRDTGRETSEKWAKGTDTDRYLAPQNK